MKPKWMQKLSFLLETTCSPPTAAFCDVKDNAKEDSGNSRASARYRCTSMNSEDRGALLYEQLVLCSNRKKKLPYVLTCSCAKWKHLPWTEPLRGMKNGISTMTGNIEPSATRMKLQKCWKNSALTLSFIEHTERTYRLPTSIFSGSQTICPPESASNVGKTKTYSTQLRSLQPIKRIQRISEKIAITILKESSLFAV
ncbi:hypothetical protein M514_09775 [Trichuris suis]|uniref:Uncharacterized protein n=1 Tax=Trichuris suis TaxID=68888 RepID=A0A085NMB9_9BILA|nr:hypothetical protein M514_09775 [Trichuris suis]